MSVPADALAMVPDSQQAQAPPSPDQPQATPEQPAKPSLWKNVLHGALAGLELNGPIGAIGGAIDPKMAMQAQANRQAMTQAKVSEAQGNAKFANAQAAAQWADAARKDVELKDLPASLKDDHDKAAASVVSTYTNLFGNPTAVVPDTTTDPKGAMQHLQDVTATAGSVNHSLMVHVGGQIYTWDTAAAAQSPNSLGFVNQAGKALGIAPLATMSADAWKALPNAQKVAYMDVADDLFNTVTPDPKNFAGQIARLGQEQKTLQAKVNSDPTLKPLLDHVSANLKLVQDAQGQALKNKPKTYADVALPVANARNEAQTKDVLRPDGVHIMAYNPATKQYDRDQGFAGTGAQGNRGAAASSAVGVGENLIKDIQANREKLGSLVSWIRQKGLNTPIADPDLARIQAEGISFAALNVVQHGFKSHDAQTIVLNTLEQMMKNPDATIQTIRGYTGASKEINPAMRKENAQPANEPTATGPNGHKIAFRGGKWVDYKTGAAIQ